VLGLEIDRIDRLPTPEEFATVILVDTHHDNKIIRLTRLFGWTNAARGIHSKGQCSIGTH
jgi:hypothetical protein